MAGGGRLLGMVAFLGVADLFLGGRVVDGRVLDGLGAGLAVIGHGDWYPARVTGQPPPRPAQEDICPFPRRRGAC